MDLAAIMIPLSFFIHHPKYIPHLFLIFQIIE